MKGSGPLYDELHAAFQEDLPPTPVHRFFASLPPLLRERGAPHQLIVTTSYDLALERAFLEAGEAFDVVSYLAAGRNRGKFCHVAPDGTGTLIEVPNTYATELSLEREFWRRRDVDVLEIPLERYVEALGREAGLDAVGVSV